MPWIAIEYTRVDPAEVEALKFNPDISQHGAGPTLVEAVKRLQLSADDALELVRSLIWRMSDERCNQLKMHGISTIQRERKTTIDRLKHSVHGSLRAEEVASPSVTPIPWTAELEAEARLQAATEPK